MVIDKERISVPSGIRLVAVGTLSARAPAIFFFRRQSYTFFPTFHNILMFFLFCPLFAPSNTLCRHDAIAYLCTSIYSEDRIVNHCLSIP